MQLPLQPGSPDRPTGSASTPVFSFDDTHTPYLALGGDQAVRRLVDTFYDRMDQDERFAGIRRLHQADLTEARGKLYEFLSGWLGGPPLYVEKHGHPRLRGRHMPFPIGLDQRDQWLACMADAMNTHEIEGEIRSFLDVRFAHVANFMRNAEERE